MWVAPEEAEELVAGGLRGVDVHGWSELGLAAGAVDRFGGDLEADSPTLTTVD